MRKYRAPRHPGRLLALCLLLLIALGICLLPLFSQTAFASSSHWQVTTVPPQAITRAGVAVVRLVAQYINPTQSSGQARGTPVVVTPPPASVTCTGPGVLVGDWASSNATPANTNVWILTDDALLDPAGRATCATMPPKAVLSSVTVFFSSAYNGATLPPLQVSQVEVNVLRDCPTQDAVQTQCASSAVLFSFNDSTLGEKLYPYLDVFASDETQQTAIALSGSATALQKPAPHAADPRVIASSFLIPFASAFSTTTASTLEAGTPLVNTTGELTGMQLKAGDLSASVLKSFLTTNVTQLQQVGTNAVHDQWVKGLTYLYKQPTPDYASAHIAFLAAFQANNDFLGASVMAQGTQRQVPPSSPSPIPTPSSYETGISQLINNIPLLILIGVGIILFIILLLLLNRIVARRRLQERFKVEMEEINRRTRVDAQRIAPIEPKPSATSLLSANPWWHLQPTPPAVPQPKLVLPSPTPDSAARKFCPRCGTSLPKDATSCTNCLLVLPGVAPSFPVSPPVIERVQPEPLVVVYTPEPVREVSLPPPQPPPATPSVVEEPRVLRQEVVIHLPAEELQITERVGTRLGNYKLLGLLGSGGFAEVYLGEHRYLKTKAAIKVLHRRLDIESLIGFLKEARTIANLVHPQIVRVLEFGVEGSDIDLDELEQSASSLKRGAPFLIMDYAPGGTLRRRHPKGTRVPLQSVVTYVSYVAEALDYAHQNRIIHRDIKPENMLLKQRNEVLLSDFGIAVAAHAEQSLGTQDMAGTYPYMAPEQIRGKPRPASDQYGLAIVVYELLCGTRPFQGSQWEIIEQHLNTTPASLCAKVPSLPQAVEQVVMRALSKEPSRRYENVKAFAQALEDAAR